MSVNDQKDNGSNKRGLAILLGILAVAVIAILVVVFWPRNGAASQNLNRSTTPQPTLSFVKEVTGQGQDSSGSVQYLSTPTAKFPELGELLDTESMSPVDGYQIDWDHLAKIQWREDVGLSKTEVRYAQSGKTGFYYLKEDFVIPDGFVLIFGAFSAQVTFASGNSVSYSDGFYGALNEGTQVRSLTVEDGFLLLVRNEYAQDEYCRRIAQAIKQNWAREHPIGAPSWGNFSCEGTYVVPFTIPG